jgi:hypothetical protein
MKIQPYRSVRVGSRTCESLLIAALGGIAVTVFAGPSQAAQYTRFPSPLESVRVVPHEGATFKSRLDQGELYLLKASGAAGSGVGAVDAEYSGHGADVADGVDVGIDVGLKSLRTAPGIRPSRMKWIGGDRESHTYYMIVTGSGGPLSLKLVTPAGRSETAFSDRGAIAVSLYRLSTLPAPLETLQIPVLQKIVPTILTTRKSSVYLLQAIGQARVGGGGLGQGDAEYMDYRADGVGQVDVGDGNTDYGIGVDEADLSKTPHALWWGPWRQDHTYDLLFAGTGKPIQFMFYDVDGGYGDNSPTEALTVKVYALP